MAKALKQDIDKLRAAGEAAATGHIAELPKSCRATDPEEIFNRVLGRCVLSAAWPPCPLITHSVNTLSTHTLSTHTHIFTVSPHTLSSHTQYSQSQYKHLVLTHSLLTLSTFNQYSHTLGTLASAQDKLEMTTSLSWSKHA